jgi:hypothetical protein
MLGGSSISPAVTKSSAPFPTRNRTRHRLQQPAGQTLTKRAQRRLFDGRSGPAAKEPQDSAQRVAEAQPSDLDEQRSGAGGLAERIARRPKVDPADLAVFGQVLDAKGAAAPALYVRLTDSAGSLN